MTQQLGLVEPELRGAKDVPTKQRKLAFRLHAFKPPSCELLDSPRAYRICRLVNRAVHAYGLTCVCPDLVIPAEDLKRWAEAPHQLVNRIQSFAPEPFCGSPGSLA